MKSLPATRERKQAITAHFLSGKNIEQLSDELKRVPMPDTRECLHRAMTIRAKKNPSPPDEEGAFSAQQRRSFASND